MSITQSRQYFKRRMNKSGWRWLSLLLKCYNEDKGTYWSYQAAQRAFMGISNPELRHELLNYAAENRPPNFNPMRRKVSQID